MKTTQGTSARRPPTEETDLSTIQATSTVLHGDAEQIRHAGEQHEEVHRETAVHLARRLSRERANEERHRDRQHAEVDRPAGPDDENDEQTGDAGEMNGHWGGDGSPERYTAAGRSAKSGRLTTRRRAEQEHDEADAAHQERDSNGSCGDCCHNTPPRTPAGTTSMFRIP